MATTMVMMMAMVAVVVTGGGGAGSGRGRGAFALLRTLRLVTMSVMVVMMVMVTLMVMVVMALMTMASWRVASAVRGNPVIPWIPLFLTLTSTTGGAQKANQYDSKSTLQHYPTHASA